MTLPSSPQVPNQGVVPPLGETFELIRLVWALDHRLQTTSRRMESELGVTGPQRLVIRIVGRFPGAHAEQLAVIMHLHPSTLSGILKRLERRDLLSRRPDPRDRRRALLALTAKGTALDREHEGTVESAVRAVMKELPQSKVRAAAQVLSRLAEALR